MSGRPEGSVRFVTLDEFGVVVGDADTPQEAWRQAVAEVRRLIALAEDALGFLYLMPADRGSEARLAASCLMAVFTDGKGPAPGQARDHRVLSWTRGEAGGLVSQHMVADVIAHGFQRPPGGSETPPEACQWAMEVEDWDDDLLERRYCWQDGSAIPDDEPADQPGPAAYSAGQGV